MKILPLILIGLLIFTIGCSEQKPPTINQQSTPSAGGCEVTKGLVDNTFNNLIEITNF